MARCCLFSMLWILTNYLYIYSLKILGCTEVMSLFATNVCFIYLLSWVVLHEQFVGLRVNEYETHLFKTASCAWAVCDCWKIIFAFILWQKLHKSNNFPMSEAKRHTKIVKNSLHGQINWYINFFFKIVAVILSNTGIALLAYMDGITQSPTLGGVVLAAAAAAGSAIYKVRKILTNPN